MQILTTKKSILGILLLFFIISCKQDKKIGLQTDSNKTADVISYAKGFYVEKSDQGITTLKITSPWPNAESQLTYALIPKEKLASISLNEDEFDAIIPVPVERIVVTSTTHIPALEALGVDHTLIGFPDTEYISSKKTRKRIDSGEIRELGNNESLNTEMVIELNPDVVVGFSINSQNKTYETLKRSNIPVVYNGDWTEETPLGKAEWIKFFAPFFEKEIEADSIFKAIETSYQNTKKLAQTAINQPTIISGAMYKDVWYLPGGKSWAAQFLRDANANYLWQKTSETGSISLSWETVLEHGEAAEFWIGPAQFTSYEDMSNSSKHYEQFQAFQRKNVFTFSATKGATGGLLYYELAPQRPDLVLKDLIQILHPELLPNHKSTFFKPLD